MKTTTKQTDNGAMAMALMTVRELAAKIVDESAEAGGEDEVRAIAERGWRDDVVLAELTEEDARKVLRQCGDEYDIGSLEAAELGVAKHMNLPASECEALWDGERYTVRAIDATHDRIARAIQAEARKRLAASTTKQTDNGALGFATNAANPGFDSAHPDLAYSSPMQLSSVETALWFYERMTAGDRVIVFTSLLGGS